MAQQVNKSPVIHVYTICWNESMMLPHFLRYYSGIAEKIVVYDNCSTDDSLKICAQFPKVQTKTYFTNNQIRDDIYLQIKNQSWKQSRGQADFVIVCDIDEWVYHTDLLNFLAKSKLAGTTAFRCMGYNMISEVTPTLNMNLLTEIRQGIRSSSFDKMLVFDPNSIEEINYEYGSHSCMPVGDLNMDSSSLKLLHYKYMGIDYLLARYRQMGARLSKQNRKLKLGHHYLFSGAKIKNEFNAIWKKKEQVI